MKQSVFLVLFCLFATSLEATESFDYFRQGFGLTQGHDEFKFDTQIDIRWEAIRFDPVIVEFDQNFRMPFSQDKEQPKYVYSLTRMRTKFLVSENFRPFLSFRYDSVRGEELPSEFWGTGVGAGVEWQGAFDNGLHLRAAIESGWLYTENEEFTGSGDNRLYLETGLDAWWVLPRWNRFVEILPRLKARTQHLSTDSATQDTAVVTPAIGLRFPNQTEFGFFTDFFFNRGNDLAYTTEQESMTFGLEYRSPLQVRETRMSTWAPLFYLELNAMTNHETTSHEVRSQLVPQLVRLGPARLQFMIEAAFIRYLRRNDPSTTLYILDVGPRASWLHGDSHDEGFAWTLDARAFHRSEHISNPSSVQNTDGPETAYLELGTPGYAHRRVKRTNSLFDAVQLAARYQVFIFVSKTRQPQWREEDYIVRFSGRLFPFLLMDKKLFGGDVYLEGQRAFFGEDVIRWNIEAGWQRKNWMLFYKSESIALGHQPAFENRIEHFAGVRVFFFN